MDNRQEREASEQERWVTALQQVEEASVEVEGEVTSVQAVEEAAKWVTTWADQTWVATQ